MSNYEVFRREKEAFKNLLHLSVQLPSYECLKKPYTWPKQKSLRVPWISQHFERRFFETTGSSFFMQDIKGLKLLNSVKQKSLKKKTLEWTNGHWNVFRVTTKTINKLMAKKSISLTWPYDVHRVTIKLKNIIWI